MKEVTDDGKTINGDAEFLTNSNAPESVKLEMEKLENLIFALSSTPNLSFDNLKGSIGNISGIALKLLFLDSMIKAKMNEGDNKTMIQRILNIITSGIAKSTKIKIGNQESKIDIKFNTILPNDLKEAVEIMSTGKGANIISTETAIDYLDLSSDSKKELELIKSETIKIN
jgi:SPP1 family phage portal protein